MQFDRLKRRDLLALLGGAEAWPIAARAQQPDRVRRIGVLVSSDEKDLPGSDTIPLHVMWP